MLLILVALMAYLIGAIPIGYLVGRAKGINLFQVGSGNIGATNVGRILGRKWGMLVFLLDFAKGALPTFCSLPVTKVVAPDAVAELSHTDWVLVIAALAAFVGHLFPVYLGFRGGKGVATGAGAVLVLVPEPTVIALVIFLAVATSFRKVSLGSIIAALALCMAQLLIAGDPFGSASILRTMFCLGAVSLVIIKHRSNMVRLIHGTENHLEDTLMLRNLGRFLQLVALSLWFGSAVFFGLVAAPAIFASFDEVVRTAPSDRTAHLPLAPDADATQKDQLGKALAGAAVGPIFPRFFILQIVCGFIVLMTVWGRRSATNRFSRLAVPLVGVTWLTVLVSWPISLKVSALRLARFSPDSAIAQAARDAFGPWHLVSLGLSMLTMLLLLVVMWFIARSLDPSEKTQPV